MMKQTPGCRDVLAGDPAAVRLSAKEPVIYAYVNLNLVDDRQQVQFMTIQNEVGASSALLSRMVR